MFKLILPLTHILRHTDGSFVAKRSLMFNLTQTLFTVQAGGASGGSEVTRGSTSQHRRLQIISRQGHDHHRPSLAAWEVVRGGPESGKLLRSAARSSTHQRPSAPTTYNSIASAAVTTRARNRATIGTICRRFVVAGRVARRRPPSARLHGKIVRLAFDRGVG